MVKLGEHAVVLGASMSGLLAARVLAAAETDTVVAERFFGVMNLIDAPSRLLSPAIMFRVATANRRRRRGTAQSKIQPTLASTG